MMLNYFYYLNVVFYENYLSESVISDGCNNIYLILIYRKNDKNFYNPHDRHSSFSLCYHYSIFFG